MKYKIISIIMIAYLLINSISALAVGDPNANSGSGGMGSGTSSNTWTPGYDGIRVSIVNVQTETRIGIPIDYTNKNPSSDIMHFGKKSKIDYTNGSTLSPVIGEYKSKNPVGNMPYIISSNSVTASLESIKAYFCSDGAAYMIANDFNISFATLTSGQYKLLIEPIAYFKFNGNNVAMTAHEAALYDLKLNGGLRSKMVSLTHQNLPLALFLERPDLDFPAYKGNKSARQSNSTIISSLGLATVSYVEPPPEDPEPSETNVKYRVNTEVITSVTLNTFEEINPDSPATVTFNIDGQIHTMSNIVIPEGESQVVWCKWTTPPTAQKITITVSTNKGYLSENIINAKIVNLNKSQPPNPTATDRNDNFNLVSIPTKSEKTYKSWSIWYAVWEEKWVWIPLLNWCSHTTWVTDNNNINGGYWDYWGHWEDNGYLEDQGEYKFFADVYSATLTSTSTITPDSKVPTASGKTMGSGYGINNKVNATISSSAPTYHITGAQTAVSYFPEFEYDTYWRLLDLTVYGYSTQLEFKHNKYSTYNQRCHFTPIWYPNGTYTVYTYLQDAWTPAGMLSMNLKDNVTINKSVFDDWRISPKN